MQKKKKNKHELPKNQEEYWPLYKIEKEGNLGQDNEEEKKKLEKIFDITPTSYDAVIKQDLIFILSNYLNYKTNENKI